MVKQTLRDFFLGFIKIHILYHAAKEPIYDQEFSDELKRHGYEISFGTLYPIFHKLEYKFEIRDEMLYQTFLGQYIITNTPTRHIMPPMMSYLSGFTLSIFHPHNIDRITNTPPYAA